MATDKVHFRHVSVPPRGPAREEGRLAAEGRRLSDAGRLAGQARAGRGASRGCPAGRAGLSCWVQGTRRDVRLHEWLDCHRLEIAYSRFERILELPGISESAEIAASYRDGMLLVRIHDGGPAVTSANLVDDAAIRAGVPGLPAGAAAEEHGPVPLPVPAALGRAARSRWPPPRRRLASEDKTFVAVAQRNPQAEQPTADDLYTVGTKAVIKKMARSGGRDRAAGPGRSSG